MKIYSKLAEGQLSNTIVTFGKFEGLHKGHKKLIETMIKESDGSLCTTVFTFAPHPNFVLYPNVQYRQINTLYEKNKKIERMGVDAIVEYPFNEEFMSMSAESFIKEIVVKLLNSKKIVVGKDFRFGYKREGNVDMLEKYGERYGFKVYALNKKEVFGEIASSSAIRRYIEAGNIERANDLIGEEYSIIETVQHGRKLGRTIGVPTTNLIPAKDKVLPPSGVYISKTLINGTEYEGISNIGYKPTVEGTPFKGVETYMFDFDGDLYGQEIEVKLYSFLRKEKKFAGLEQLKLQISMDIDEVKTFFDTKM